MAAIKGFACTVALSQGSEHMLDSFVAGLCASLKKSAIRAPQTFVHPGRIHSWSKAVSLIDNMTNARSPLPTKPMDA